MSDGTFTIDNTGYLGSNLTMAIIDVREVTILTMEAITKRPATVEAPQGDVIAVCSTTRRCAAPSGL